MTSPSFLRLVRTYERRLASLFRGHLSDPWLLDSFEFRQAASALAGQMAKMVAAENMKSWRAAAMKSTRARQIYAALRQEILENGLQYDIARLAEQNAALISSLPRDVARQVAEKAAEFHQQGLRPAELAKAIREYAPHLTKSRIKLIARTETGKSETALTRIRAERTGLGWAQWSTSEDSRVRPSHRNLDKVLMSWNDAPQPETLIGEPSRLGRGFGGEFPNCRCVMLPLVTLDEIHFPCRVYRSGAIKTMGRAAFAKVSGWQVAA